MSVKKVATKSRHIRRKEPAPAAGKTSTTARKQQLSPSLARISQRSLLASEEQIRSFIPREIDLAIAEAYLSGCITFKEVAESIGVCASTVSDVLKDPVVCAWVSRHIHASAANRLGMVDAAMLKRALSGDVRAADLFYRRYGEMVHRSFAVNVSAAYDVTKLSDKDLDAILAAQAHESRPKNPPANGARGDEAEGA